MKCELCTKKLAENDTLNDEDVNCTNKSHLEDVTEGQNTIHKTELTAKLDHFGQIDLPSL